MLHVRSTSRLVGTQHASSSLRPKSARRRGSERGRPTKRVSLHFEHRAHFRWLRVRAAGISGDERQKQLFACGNFFSVIYTIYMRSFSCVPEPNGPTIVDERATRLLIENIETMNQPKVAREPATLANAHRRPTRIGDANGAPNLNSATFDERTFELPEDLPTVRSEYTRVRAHLLYTSLCRRKRTHCRAPLPLRRRSVEVARRSPWHSSEKRRRFRPPAPPPTSIACRGSPSPFHRRADRWPTATRIARAFARTPRRRSTRTRRRHCSALAAPL